MVVLGMSEFLIEETHGFKKKGYTAFLSYLKAYLVPISISEDTLLVFYPNICYVFCFGNWGR